MAEALKPRVILFRHGATDYNSGAAGELVRGHLNPPLNADGKAEAKRLGGEFAKERVQKIYSSDLDRAHDTAKAVQSAHPFRPPLAPKYSLRPWDAGPTIAGKDVKSVLPKMLEYQLDKPDERPPGGASFNEYLRTFLPQLARIFKEARHNPELGAILISTHTRGMRAVDARMRATGGLPEQPGLKVDSQVFRDPEHIKTGGWLEYQHDGQKWNEVSRHEPGSTQDAKSVQSASKTAKDSDDATAR